MSGREHYGEAQAFLGRAIAYESDGCLLWPYSDNGKGYATAWDPRQRKTRAAGVIVCEIVHGPKPPGTEMRHTCGVRACVAPRHLSWGSHIENLNDKRTHGTMGRKLNQQRADEIRRIYKEKQMTQQQLADRFGVSQVMISQIVLNKTWRLTR